MAASGRAVAPTHSTPFLLLTIGVVGVLTLVRLATLQATSLNLLPDEAQYWAWAQQLDLGYFSKPPLIAWLIAGSTALCGDGEACVRLSSPLLHAATALLIFALARELADSWTAFWSAVAYATVPGVSFSALLISTDVPLLLSWAVALLAFVKWLRTGRVVWAVLLGVAIGTGMLAKYAMIYFVLCAGLYLAISRQARASLRLPHLVAVLLIAGAITAPNLLWNLRNGWPTIEHTAANANWSGELFNPAEAVEFVVAQFGVFGPILFGALAWRLLIARRLGLSEAERLLACFVVPVLLVVTLQAFISRAHANWAAPAYIAATVLATIWLVGEGRPKAAAASIALHTAFLLVLYGYVAGLRAAELPRWLDPVFSRQRGWDALGSAVQRQLERLPGSTLMADERKLTAELVYYTREQRPPIVVWSHDRTARNYFEATAAFDGRRDARLLLVTADENPQAITSRFDRVAPAGTIAIPVGVNRTRLWRLFELEGFRP